MVQSIKTYNTERTVWLGNRLEASSVLATMCFGSLFEHPHKDAQWVTGGLMYVCRSRERIVGDDVDSEVIHLRERVNHTGVYKTASSRGFQLSFCDGRWWTAFIWDTAPEYTQTVMKTGHTHTRTKVVGQIKQSSDTAFTGHIYESILLTTDE